MPDDLSKRHPLDGQRINTTQPYELYNWTRIFKCSEQDIKDAVNKVGNSVTAVRNYLARKKRS